MWLPTSVRLSALTTGAASSSEIVPSLLESSDWRSWLRTLAGRLSKVIVPARDRIASRSFASMMPSPSMSP